MPLFVGGDVPVARATNGSPGKDRADLLIPTVGGWNGNHGIPRHQADGGGEEFAARPGNSGKGERSRGGAFGREDQAAEEKTVTRGGGVGGVSAGEIGSASEKSERLNHRDAGGTNRKARPPKGARRRSPAS